MTITLKGNFIYVLIVVLVFVLLQKVAGSLSIFDLGFNDLLILEFVNKSIKNSIVIILAVFSYYKLRQHSIDTYAFIKVSNIPTFFILIILSMTLFYSVTTKAQNVGYELISYYLVHCFLTGIAEELVFRGLIQSKLVTDYGKMKGVLVSAMIFGLLHFLNLIKNPDNLNGILNQVIFAFSIGFVFGGLVLKLNNVMLIGIFHGIINFTLNFNEIMPETYTDNTMGNENELISVIFTYFMFFIIAMVGFLLVKSEEVKENST
jgi:CAAX protease family protein